MHTLNHILTVDWFYAGALEDACPGYSVFDVEIPCPAFKDLDREQRSVDRRLVAACRNLTPARLEEPVRLIRAKKELLDDRTRVLLHLFQHQIHHRGQVHAMLSGTSVMPPQLDEFFLDSPEERALRAGDLVELGFSETSVWR